MTKDDVLRMAQEAGWEMGDDLSDGFGVRLERFAALVAAAERDAILKMSESQWYISQKAFEVAIRARGQA